ncbi:hypothetical protein D3C73_765070 [compost metagenome]
MNNATTNKNDVTIFAIIHNDVPADLRKSIYADYLSHVMGELESISGRKFHVVLGTGEPYSSFVYKDKDRQSMLKRWESLGYKYLQEAEQKGFDTRDLNKVILLTKYGINEETSGIALIDPRINAGKFAISSLERYLNPGHEIGHLLGATHENAEVQYNGWWCETYMTAQPQPIRSTCYKFSETNRQAIKNYLATQD